MRAAWNVCNGAWDGVVLTIRKIPRVRRFDDWAKIPGNGEALLVAVWIVGIITLLVALR